MGLFLMLKSFQIRRCNNEPILSSLLAGKIRDQKGDQCLAGLMDFILLNGCVDYSFVRERS